MTKQFIYKITFACAILFCLGIDSASASASADAVEDGFGRAQKIEGKHFVIYYVPDIALSGLMQQLNVTPSDKLLAGKSSEKGFSLEGELADMLDTLFTRVCNVLDMQLYSFKGNIKICRDSGQLNYIYHQVFNNNSRNMTRSFYAFANNTIYTSPENFMLGIIGHEMAHAIISHYFVVLPSVKIQEVLSAYVEYQLRNSGQ